ncbi:MAG: SufD family Fe-S cluster assembly protein, partial [Gammaproteobacteria bacterium]
TRIYPETESYRLLFVNGQCVPGLSNIEQLPASIKIGSLRAALSTDKQVITDTLSKRHDRQDDVFSALNRALLNDGLFIHVGADAVVPRPVEVVYLNINFEHHTLSQPHSLVILEPGAVLKLVEHHTSTGSADYFFNGINEIILGENFNRHQVQQQRASDYRAWHIASGGGWNRTDVNVDFAGTQANCELQGLYTAGSGQYTDIHLDVQHSLPACRSRENYRGIVHGKGRAVFDGRIVVAKDAQGSDASLSNRNLLLSENAEIDTKPQLEIYADDVKCAHGTTVGRLDPQQVFYLRSRGIPEPEARRMLCMGFAEQILATVEDERLHKFMLKEVTDKLQQQEVDA